VAIVVLGALLFSSGAQACSCIERTPRQALREADAAFVGRLVGVVSASGYSATYNYLVRRVYKRGQGIRAGGTVSVRSGLNGASCGFPTDKGHWYGLFLYRSENRWTGGLCGLVAPRQLSAAAAALRKGTALAAAAGGPGCAS
jgi:hypothetical protein